MKTRDSLFALFFFILASAGCSQHDPSQPLQKVVEIAGRDEGNPEEKTLIYRIKVPSTWKEHRPQANESIADSKKALIEFFIEDQNEKIRIAIHNFPSDKIEQRIPPQAQLSRWKKQFTKLIPSTTSTKPQAFGGYSGFLLEATGEINGIPTTILGWALQLAPEHYQALSHPISLILFSKQKQMRGDVTIKAVGPKPLMHKYREEIIFTARTFQLIDDIP